MKSATVALLSCAVFLAAAWAGTGMANAGESGWWTEEGTVESRDVSPVPEEQFQPGEAAETGSLPSTGESSIWVEPEMGSSLDYAPEGGHSTPDLE